MFFSHCPVLLSVSTSEDIFCIYFYNYSHYLNSATLLTPDHPKWLGAWWLGYFACFVVNSVICIPTFFLPEDFRKGDSELKDNNNPSTSQQSTNPQSRRMSIFETNAIGKLNNYWQELILLFINLFFSWPHKHKNATSENLSERFSLV